MDPSFLSAKLSQMVEVLIFHFKNIDSDISGQAVYVPTLMQFPWAKAK